MFRHVINVQAARHELRKCSKKQAEYRTTILVIESFPNSRSWIHRWAYRRYKTGRCGRGEVNNVPHFPSGVWYWSRESRPWTYCSWRYESLNIYVGRLGDVTFPTLGDAAAAAAAPKMDAMPRRTTMVPVTAISKADFATSVKRHSRRRTRVFWFVSAWAELSLKLRQRRKLLCRAGGGGGKRFVPSLQVGGVWR